jgi:hypothetical protein
MVDAVTTQILEQGPRFVVIKFTNLSDGTGEAAVLKVDVSTLSGYDSRIPDEVTIQEITYSLTGMSVEILWDAAVDQVAWILTPDADNEIHFRDYPIKNNAAAGKTGDIRFTTINAGAGDSYSIILKLIKVYL